MSQIDINAIVRKYIELRDAAERITKEAKTKVAELEAAQDTLASVLMKLAQEQGVTSFKTDAGTAFIATKTHAGVADWNRVVEYIKANDAFNLLNKAVNKTAVQEYIQKHETPPPGVNWTTMQEIQVRRT